MEIQPTSDHGQKLPPPAGKVIGFVDTQANFEAFTQSLQRAGIPASRITSIEGGDIAISCGWKFSGGGYLWLDSIDELNSGDHLGHELRTVQQPPSLGGGLHQLEDHRQARRA
jgi:hypothetical protein